MRLQITKLYEGNHHADHLQKHHHNWKKTNQLQTRCFKKLWSKMLTNYLSTYQSRFNVQPVFPLRKFYAEQIFDLVSMNILMLSLNELPTL